MYVSNDAQPGCEEQPFCDRFRSFMDHPELQKQSDVYYYIEESSVKVDYGGIITGELNLGSKSDGSVAQKLDLTLTIY